jgi:hypothetical protein
LGARRVEVGLLALRGARAAFSGATGDVKETKAKVPSRQPGPPAERGRNGSQREPFYLPRRFATSSAPSVKAIEKQSLVFSFLHRTFTVSQLSRPKLNLKNFAPYGFG